MSLKNVRVIRLNESHEKKKVRACRNLLIEEDLRTLASKILF